MRTEPAQLTQLAAALRSTDHLEIARETLCEIVGPRPEGLDDRELVTTLNDLETWKKLTNPPLTLVPDPDTA